LWILLSNTLPEEIGVLDSLKFAHISFVFPVVGTIFTWLAIRGILKDITLIKSFDRIR
jgi:hypothetical protein